MSPKNTKVVGKASASATNHISITNPVSVTNFEVANIHYVPEPGKRPKLEVLEKEGGFQFYNLPYEDLSGAYDENLKLICDAIGRFPKRIAANALKTLHKSFILIVVKEPFKEVTENRFLEYKLQVINAGKTAREAGVITMIQYHLFKKCRIKLTSDGYQVDAMCELYMKTTLGTNSDTTRNEFGVLIHDLNFNSPLERVLVQSYLKVESHLPSYEFTGADFFEFSKSLASSWGYMNIDSMSLKQSDYDQPQQDLCSQSSSTESPTSGEGSGNQSMSQSTSPEQELKRKRVLKPEVRSAKRHKSEPSGSGQEAGVAMERQPKRYPVAISSEEPKLVDFQHNIQGMGAQHNPIQFNRRFGNQQQHFQGMGTQYSQSQPYNHSQFPQFPGNQQYNAQRMNWQYGQGQLYNYGQFLQYPETEQHNIHSMNRQYSQIQPCNYGQFHQYTGNQQYNVQGMNTICNHRQFPQYPENQQYNVQIIDRQYNQIPSYNYGQSYNHGHLNQYSGENHSHPAIPKQ